jgi:hypothetical protein
MDRLMSKGWTREQSLGIVANLDRESGFNPDDQTVDSDGLVHRGIASWSPKRQEAFQKWSGGKSIIGSSLDEQVDFLHNELTGSEYHAGDRLRSDRTANQAAQDVAFLYERPGGGGAETSRRGALADEWGNRLPANGSVKVDVNVNVNGAQTTSTASSSATGVATAGAPRVTHTGVGR